MHIYMHMHSDRRAPAEYTVTHVTQSAMNVAECRYIYLYSYVYLYLKLSIYRVRSACAPAEYTITHVTQKAIKSAAPLSIHNRYRVTP